VKPVRAMGKGCVGCGAGSGEGKGGCSCCCGPVDLHAPDPANVSRWVTDIAFLLGFGVFWVGMIVVASMGFAGGDISRLLYFVDYNGNRCGSGDLADYKYVHWTHPGYTGSNVCVKECPNAAYIKFTLSTNASYVGSTNIGYTSSQSTAATCTLESMAWASCLQSASTVTMATMQSTWHTCCTIMACPAPSGIYVCVPEAVSEGASNQAKEYVDAFATMMASATADLMVGWYIIIASAFIALIMSFIWSYILKYSAGCFVWSVVFLSNFMVMAATGLSFYMYNKYATAFDDTALSSDEQMMYLMLVCLVVFGCAAFILFCMTICMCKQIRIAIGIIEAACEAVQTMPLIIFFPLISYFFMLVFCAYWCIVALFLASTGDYVKDELTGAYTMAWNEDVQNAATYHFFGFLWTMAFIRHMTILCLAGAFGVWYWTSLPEKEAGKFYELHPRPIMGSVCRSFTYHIGTVAFGSFIIACIQFAQAVLEYVKKKQDSKLLKYVIACVQCILKCFEKLMEYVSKCAYIVTACKGNMFCTAALASFGFLFKHMGQHAIVQYISVFLMGLGKAFILCTTVAVCFLLASTDSGISSPYILLAVCAVIAYLVACLFLGVFDVAIDTILVCFCWEKDANGAMENAEGEKMIYGTMGLIKFIDGAQKMAAELAAGGGGDTPASAPEGVTEVAPAAAPAEPTAAS